MFLGIDCLCECVDVLALDEKAFEEEVFKPVIEDRLGKTGLEMGVHFLGKGPIELKDVGDLVGIES